MEYWEFLIQKEGDRTWKPIKSPRMEIEPGRYRVVAHSSLKNAEVEISVVHQSMEEIPPRRKYQKRSRRTSPEGLMVVIPFTQLKSGLWELRCCGDIMSEFLGDPWQESIQLQVGTTVSEVLPKTQPESSLVDTLLQGVPADLRETVPLGSGSEPMVATTQAKTEDTDEATLVATSEPEPAVASKQNAQSTEHKVLTHTPAQELTPTDEDLKAPLPKLPIEALDSNPALATAQPASSESQPAVEPTLVEAEVITETPLAATAAAQKSETWLKNQTDLASPLPYSQSPVPQEKNNGTTENGQDPHTTNLQQWDLPVANPILEQSLQTLEQIMQQVLEPVLDEFEQPESSEQQLPVEPTQIAATPENELYLETITNRLGLILTLDEQALVAQREEPLAIVGQLDVLDIHQLDDPENQRVWQEMFPGRLCYELRDPQTSQVLLNIQHPLSAQAPPLTFSHKLELPANCNTRLLVGKVTFYGSNSQALVSQSFTVTADLDDVLGSILLGGKTMPVETMLALADHLTTSQEHQQKPAVSASPQLNEALLDLVDAPPTSQPRTWERSSSNPLPPQLRRKDSAQKSSKSLDLPNFRKLRSVSNGESDASEVISTILSPSILASLPLTSSTMLNQPEQVELKQEDAESQSSGNEQLQPEVPIISSKIPHQEPANQEEDTAPDSQLLLEGIQPPDATTEESTVTEAEASASTLGARELSEPPSNLDLELDNSDSITSDEISTLPENISEVEHNQKAPAADTQLSDSDSIGEADAPESEIPSAESQTAQVSADEPNNIENEFQALKLQDRFWSRLNSLVTDTDLSTSPESNGSAVGKSAEVEKLRDNLNSNGVISEQAPEQEQLPSQEQLEFTEQLPPDTVMADFDESLWEGAEDFGDEIADTANSPFVSVANRNWSNQEIVVEEELLGAKEKTLNGEASEIAHQGETENKSAPEITYPAASDVPIPAPELFIPTSELNAGEPVTVRIKLPPHPSRLYVKLWIKDRQSRSILDGPRSFVDFLPNASGELEELTQLIVPFGTVEIRFEAIAIDIYSQRESHKVAVDCKVVSSDLPSISLEEFET